MKRRLLIACIGNTYILTTIMAPRVRPKGQKNKGDHKAGGSRKKKVKADPKQPGIFEFTLGWRHFGGLLLVR